FGGAACLSTHWPGIFTVTKNPVPAAFLNYLADNLPDPKNHKLYFDFGTETLDAWYEPYQLKADSIIISKGFNKENFLSKKFDGDPHDEKAWNRRFHVPLTFLLSD
ncbi:MAG: esterase, partial [Bacteroidota bacterium]